MTASLTVLALSVSAMGQQGLSAQEAQTAEPGNCSAMVPTCALVGGWPLGLAIEQVYQPHVGAKQPSLGPLGPPHQEERQEDGRRLPPVVLGGVIGAAAGAGLGYVLQNNGAKCGDSSSCVIIGGALGMAFGVVLGLVVPDSAP